MNVFFLQCRRTILLPCGFFVAGVLGLTFLVDLGYATAASVIIFVTLYAVIVTNFFLLDTYTPEVFSTDSRNFSFALLDSISKVMHYYYKHHELPVLYFF